MMGFLRLTSLDGEKTGAINLSHVKYYKLVDAKIIFIVAISGTRSTKIIKNFESEDLAKDYYNRLTEYLEINI